MAAGSCGDRRTTGKRGRSDDGWHSGGDCGLFGLNAAIEAPRAGELGCSFNVVPGEVRKPVAKVKGNAAEMAGKIKATEL
ncbi:MAG: methyl-accepting chemotaxis protein [Peptococcaceae bacterium]|jgi:hypothetical protein|nr:methyl-accepting chemotaxis protein [Peptococcaceae bacterium]